MLDCAASLLSVVPHFLLVPNLRIGFFVGLETHENYEPGSLFTEWAGFILGLRHKFDISFVASRLILVRWFPATEHNPGLRNFLGRGKAVTGATAGGAIPEAWQQMTRD
jgi:hypothetical protein